MMTKVGQLFEEEKLQYGKEIEERVTRDVTKRVTEKVTKKVTERVTKKVTERVTTKVTRSIEMEFTKKMLCTGLSVKEVSKMMTMLTEQDVEKIAEKIKLTSDGSVDRSGA